MRASSRIALTVSIRLVAAFAPVTAVAALAACSGSDPGGILLGPGGHAGGSGAAEDGGASQGGEGGASVGVDGGSGGATGTDSGASTGGGDAGTASHDAAPPSTNAFTGAGAYASAPPGTQAQGAHGFSLADRNCYDCHGANPSSGIHFTFAGRVFADSAGQTPAADVEVRAVDHNGAASSAHSDSSGYFWVKGGTLALPALTGARNAQSTALMAAALTDANKGGGCNGCHNGTTTAYLHVP